MASVKFDSTEILDTTHIPQFVKHESAPNRNLISVSVARDDGDIVIAERYGSKVISLKGFLRASTQADLDDAIDTFKELFSRPEKNLDISWSSGTRRYVVTCTKHEFDRDHYHTNGVPWTAEFTVATGVGTDTAATTPISASSISTADDGGWNFVYESSFTMSGSKPAAPVITLAVTSADSNMLGIEFKNLDTGERILVTDNSDWSSATLVIDCANKRVLFNDEEHNFFGLFPTFKIGTNNFRITTGGIINQESSDTGVSASEPFAQFSSSNTRFAQSFIVPYTDDTFGAFLLGLSRASVGGTPAGNFFGEIFADDGTGLPDVGGSTIASFTITPSDIPVYTTFEYVPAWSGAFTLNANTRYWLVVGSQSSSGTEYYLLAVPVGDTYPRGTSLDSTDAGSNWSADGQIPAFRIMVGGQPKATDIDLTVEYTKTYL